MHRMHRVEAEQELRLSPAVMKRPNYLGDDGLVHGTAMVQGMWKLACSWFCVPWRVSGIAEAHEEPITCLPCLVEVLSGALQLRR